MTGNYLESGTITEFQPLGVGGDPLHSYASNLRAEITRRLGEDVAASIAIPQVDQAGSTLDWYAPEPGQVRNWADLSQEEQTRAWDRLQNVHERVAALASEMTREDGPDDVPRERQMRGRLLAHATTIPDESHIFLVGERPVIAFWGFRSRGERDPTQPIASGLRIDQIPKPPQRPAPGRGEVLQSRMREHMQPIMTSILDRPHALWGLLAVLILALIGIALLSGGDNPVADDPSPAPIEPLIIPSQAIETGSTSFLTGHWRAVGDELIDSETKQPISLAYRLDGGSGEVLVAEQDGTVCSAPIEAAFDADALNLNPLTAIECPAAAGRKPYFGIRVVCRPSTDQRAECLGSFPNGESVRVELLRDEN